MSIAFDARELARLKEDLTAGQQMMVRDARRVVRAVSLAVEKRVKQEMPVDSGRARASWGHWSAGGSGDGADAVWYETDGGLTITQGSNVVYVPALNDGHSRQAPAGFIDSAALQGEIELLKKLGFIDPLDPNLGYLED